MTQENINAADIRDWTIRWTRTAKAIIDKLVSDCLETSKETLKRANIQNLSDIYNSKENLIALSDKSESLLKELEDFLLQNFYLHQSLIQTTEKIQTWLEQLFTMLCKKPDLMPGYFQRFIKQHGLQRAVCDYIAGMTDGFCMKMLEEM